MSFGKLTYSKSGVNIKKADKFVKHISYISRKTNKSGDFKNIGGFGAISHIPKNLKNPHLVTSTDGVGTKIEIANEKNRAIAAEEVNALGIITDKKSYFVNSVINVDTII